MTLKINHLLVRKPSSFFWIISLICFFSLLIIGNPNWRHVDDFGPLQALNNQEIFSSINNLDTYRNYFKRLISWGWGTYPPIWQHFTFFSYLFKPFGLDIVRSICFALGFFSLIISSLLTYTICFLIKEKSNFKKKKLGNNFYIELLSIFVNILNPEIILHSNSNMPYNLATITLQVFVIFIFLIIENKEFSKNNFIGENKYLFINSKLIIIFLLFSILLSFQSLILISSLVLTYFIYIFKKDIKLEYKKIFRPKKIIKFYISLFEIFNFKKFIKIFLICALSFYLILYVIKISTLILFFGKAPGDWAYGIDNIYDLSNIIQNPFLFIEKILNSTQSIIGQSLYPFRIYQKEASIVISLIILLCFLKIRNKNILSNYFLIFSSIVLLVTIFLSSISNFIYSPTRHTIFLYPIFWIPLILTLDNILLSRKIILLRHLSIILVYIYFSLGSFISIKQIAYSEGDNNKLLNLLEKSDFYLPKSYDPYSNISTHGSKEAKLTNEKKCNPQKINNLKKYKLFIFSHREPFSFKENQMKNILENPLNKNCFPKSVEFKIIDKTEKFNKLDLEQNNFIFNGGSNLFGYVLEVKNKDLDFK